MHTCSYIITHYQLNKHIIHNVLVLNLYLFRV